LRRFLSAARHKCPIHQRARAPVSRASEKNLGKSVRTNPETDRRRSVQHAIGRLRGPGVESLFACDRAKSTAVDDCRSPRGQTRDEFDERRETVATLAF